MSEVGFYLGKKGYLPLDADPNTKSIPLKEVELLLNGAILKFKWTKTRQGSDSIEPGIIMTISKIESAYLIRKDLTSKL